MADPQYFHAVCQCSSEAHTLHFSYYPDDDELVVTTHLNIYLPWYKRIIPAIRYALGMKTTTDHFDSTLFRPEDAVKFNLYMLKMIESHTCKNIA